MKKTLLFLLSLALLSGSVMAQSQKEREEIRKAHFERFHKRDASKLYLQKNYPIQETVKASNATKDAAGLQLPAQRWFPGEWEEVQAIVVTCSYNHYVPGHEGDMYYAADPVVSGVADYYHYSGMSGWQEMGQGPYTSVPDTSNDDFANVFFYVMDAIQLGGAQAWVRIEAAEDSNMVLRKLARMNLRHDNIRFIVGPGNSFWFRDCGPIAFYYGEQDSVAMVDFEYYTGRALDDSLPTLIEEQMGIPNYITTIEWEGGNCLVDGAGLVISSDAIYANNRDGYGQFVWDGVNPSTITYQTRPILTKDQVRDSLAHIMGPRGAKIIPTFKYDGGTGHIDLYADMVDENTFVYSKFPTAYSNWYDYKVAQKNIDTMWNWQSYFGDHYNHVNIPFPCTNNGGNFSSQSVYNSQYTRTYSNHTFVNNVLIQPVFSSVVNGVPSAAWDRERFDSLQIAYPGYTIYPINVASFDGSGGAIHCITKQIPADNPIRILHKSVTGDANRFIWDNSDVEVKASITNRSGIASVKCYYRQDGGRWNELDMVAGTNNEYSATIPTLSMDWNNQGLINVEYYISATSNNGKTITKPMTAGQGGYYAFSQGRNAPHVGIETVDVDHVGHFYPNPANGNTSIDIDLAQGTTYQVSIVDMTGRTVHQTSLQGEGKGSFTLNTSKLANGVYNVVFTANNGQRVMRRLVVK